MGKRRNEQPPGGNIKFHVPQTKRSFQEDSGDDGVDATGPSQTGDADGKGHSWGQTTPSSTGTGATRSPNGNGEAVAPEQSRVGEHVPSPSPQEGRDTGIAGGDTLLEAAAPGAASQPQSPQRVNSALDETEEDQPVVTTERHGSAGEEPDAKTQTHHGRGNIGDSPEPGHAVPTRGEGAAGREIALPVVTPSSTSVLAQVPDPHREEGGNHSECRGDTDQSQEPPRAVVNDEENESGVVLERAAGGEHRETVSGERLPATSRNNVVKNMAESWCSPAGSGVLAGVSGVCAPSAEPTAQGGNTEPETVAAAGTASSQGGNSSPWKMSGEADTGQEEAGGGETSSPGTSLAPDPSVPAGGNPAGKREGEGLVEECGTEQPELRGGLEGNGLELPPQQPLPATNQCDAAVPGREPRAVGEWSHAEEAPLLTEGNGPAQPQPWEDATDVVCGLILELSNLNRLAMSAHRGLEALRKSKPWRSRWPALVPPHSGRRWKQT